jgi:hypothetical protein
MEQIRVPKIMSTPKTSSKFSIFIYIALIQSDGRKESSLHSIDYEHCS